MIRRPTKGGLCSPNNFKMTLSDYLWIHEVNKEYGELGRQQRFLREFFPAGTYVTQEAISKVRAKNRGYSFDRIISDLVTLSCIVWMSVTDFNDVWPFVFSFFSESYRFRHYNADMKKRNEFTGYMKKMKEIDKAIPMLKDRKRIAYPGLPYQ